MKKGDTRSILRIRTFDEDIARARGVEIPKAPKVIKEKETAQEIADTLLKGSTPTAKDFIGTTDGDVIEMPAAKKIPRKNIPMTVPPPPVVEPEVVKISKTKTPPASKKVVVSNLKDEVQKIVAPQEKSTLTNEGVVYDASNNDLDGGTLITNKKQNKFRLFPAIAASISSWFTEKKSVVHQPKKQTPTVNKAESRIKTITAAARASKHAPQNDHGVVVKRLTKKKRKKRGMEIAVTQKEEVVAPQWGSVSDEKPETTDVPTTVTPTVDTSIPAPSVPVPVPPTVEIKDSPVPKPEKKDTPDDTGKLSRKELRAEKKRLKAEQKEMKKKAKLVQNPVPQEKRTYRATPVAISRVPIYIYVLVILGASLLGIGVSTYWFMSSTPSQEAVIVRIPTLFNADAEVSVLLNTSKEDLLSAILDVSITSRETLQVYPVIPEESSLSIPADAQTILSTLQLRAPGYFTRAITDITFGSYNGTDSFIIMKVTNFDTAFGGLLEWELDMSGDLSPLFGTPVTQSYDPYARTDTQVRSAFFRDTVVVNKSARLLVDAQDTERMMYAFVTPNIILITPNSETFKAILPLVQQ